jgi:putative flippase GtrA
MTSALNTTLRRLGWFVAVGTGAAAVHFFVVVLLVETGGWRPLVANPLGWLVAFGVSFFGHHRLTFHNSGARIGQAARRFLLISATGFAVNETSYATLLAYGAIGYQLALGVVLVAVAALTYWASRRWAFMRTDS